MLSADNQPSPLVPGSFPLGSSRSQRRARAAWGLQWWLLAELQDCSLQEQNVEVLSPTSLLPQELLLFIRGKRCTRRPSHTFWKSGNRRTWCQQILLFCVFLPSTHTQGGGEGVNRRNEFSSSKFCFFYAILSLTSLAQSAGSGQRHAYLQPDAAWNHQPFMKRKREAI